MQPHKIVSREEWIAARKAHLAHEKEFTRARDRLSEERRGRRTGPSEEEAGLGQQNTDGDHVSLQPAPR